MENNTQQAVSQEAKPIFTDIEKTNYIQSMSINMNFKLTEARQRNLLACESKSSINKMIFENLDKWKNEVTTLTEEQRKNPILVNSFSIDKTSIIQNIKTNIKNKEDNIRSYFESINARIAERQAYLVELYNIENRPDTDHTTQIDEINKGGFFEFDFDKTISKNDGYLYFITKPIILSYKNEAAKINIDGVNFGRFYCAVNLRGGRTKVLKYSKNIEYSGYIHPHVSSDGGVCWGNAANMVTDAYKSFNLVNILKALQVVLTTYNEASPYASIEKFDIRLNPHRYPVTYSYYCIDTVYGDDYDKNRSVKLGDLAEVTYFELGDDSLGDDTSYLTLEEIKDYFGKEEEELLNEYYKFNVKFYKKMLAGSRIDTNVYLKLTNGNYVSIQDFRGGYYEN